jgi:hypothetical protein
MAGLVIRSPERNNSRFRGIIRNLGGGADPTRPTVYSMLSRIDLLSYTIPPRRSSLSADHGHRAERMRIAATECTPTYGGLAVVRPTPTPHALADVPGRAPVNLAVALAVEVGHAPVDCAGRAAANSASMPTPRAAGVSSATSRASAGACSLRTKASTRTNYPPRSASGRKASASRRAW